MKTVNQKQYTSHNSHGHKVEVSIHFLLQLYALQKTAVTNKKLPRLPLHDKRRHTSIDVIRLKKQNQPAIKQVGEYLFNTFLFSES